MISLFKSSSFNSVTASGKVFHPLKMRMEESHSQLLKRLKEIKFAIPNNHVINRLMFMADTVGRDDKLEYISQTVRHANATARSLSLISEANRGKPQVGQFMGVDDLNYIYFDPYINFDPLNLDSLIKNYKNNKPLRMVYNSRNDLSDTLPLRRKYRDVGLSTYTIKLDILFITYLGFKSEDPTRDLDDFVRYLLIDIMGDAYSLAMVKRAQDQYLFKDLSKALRFKTIPSVNYTKAFDKIVKKLVRPSVNKKGYSNILLRFPTLVDISDLITIRDVYSNRYSAIFIIVTLFPIIKFLLETESKINATRSYRQKNELSRYFKIMNVKELLKTIPNDSIRLEYEDMYFEIKTRL